MTDDTLIADLVRAGVSADLIGRVANALVSQIVRDIVRDTPREYERNRKADYRANKRKSNEKPEANDAGFTRNDVPDVSRTVPDNRCDLTSFLSLESLSTEEEKKESKRVIARARGTRLTAGLPINDADREFARSLGMSSTEIQSGWAEFVDYWIGVPGQRGRKSDWPATWRNRARELVSRRGRSYGRPDESKSVLAAADRQIERLGGAEVARAYVPGSGGPQPLSLDFGAGPSNLRLLSER